MAAPSAQHFIFIDHLALFQMNWLIIWATHKKKPVTTQTRSTQIKWRQRNAADPVKWNYFSPHGPQDIKKAKACVSFLLFTYGLSNVQGTEDCCGFI